MNMSAYWRVITPSWMPFIGDLLIGVTEFFRDEDAFAKLKTLLVEVVENLEAR